MVDLSPRTRMLDPDGRTRRLSFLSAVRTTSASQFTWTTPHMEPDSPALWNSYPPDPRTRPHRRPASMLWWSSGPTAIGRQTMGGRTRSSRDDQRKFHHT